MSAPNYTTTEHIIKEWPRIVGEVKKYHIPTQALLTNTRVGFFLGNSLFILAPSVFHKENLGKSVSHRAIKRVLEELTGKDITTHFYLANEVPLNLLESAWEEIKKLTKRQSPAVQALLHGARPIDTNKDTIILLAASPFHKDHLHKDRNRLLIESVVNGLLGTKVKVDVTIEVPPSKYNGFEPSTGAFPISETAKKDIVDTLRSLRIEDEADSRILEANQRTEEQASQAKFQQIMLDHLEKHGTSGLEELLQGVASLMSMLHLSIKGIEPATINNASLANTQIIEHDGLRFRSHTETKIYDALKKRGILFFPNATAVLGVKNIRREPDFLICQDGKWGILEVMGDKYHPGTTAMKDHDRARLFKDYGMYVIEFYDANRCYNHPEEVVDEFLRLLSKL